MSEQLELVVQGMTDGEIRDLLASELPGLADRLPVREGSIRTTLARGNSVLLTFPEMAALYWFVQRHDECSYGPGHEYCATPDEILKTHTSLYLGPLEGRERRGRRVLLPGMAALVAHDEVWRKTKRTLSTNGRWYYRAVRPDESGGNPNGYRTTCPNAGREFVAREAGFAWDWERNRGRTLYRCRPCGTLFTMGVYDTPEHATLALALRSRTAVRDEQVDHLDGGVQLYRVLRQHACGIGIAHVVDGAIARAEKDDVAAAVRYLVAVSDDSLEPRTLQEEEAGPDAARHLPLAQAELESVALLYRDAYRLENGRRERLLAGPAGEQAREGW